ncbi:MULTISPECIES: 2-hydroxymuconate tautomerase [Paraburkholderia]|uniref:Tautomerase n=1 Tax=Paraburkholderia steynii TaxID=1245441 RepID=A0A7Z7FH19_9BURK|nr:MULTISPECIES: 2-hydroxymuconate tautomerase [Paraburkholderia]EUC18780.1 4-oxalocrotonate tautomerase family enzyme [Burkholderia sp. BT03]SKC83565.1 4-oxalocrotonate isomerase [Burkholderia sp. CF099]SDH25030.1 4-oxalocrotonate tautomerase [Paraburkholderia steynii]SKC61144.1 4-oxalocrotonate isomerase [Paraburkholderia hospita]SKC93315.1 4-oxalocrotonate isomerase [Paraburkholderia hospita]
MPIIQVYMMEGRSDEQKTKLIEALTSATVEQVGAPRESVRVLISEMPKTHWGIGGKTAKELGR